MLGSHACPLLVFRDNFDCVARAGRDRYGLFIGAELRPGLAVQQHGLQWQLIRRSQAQLGSRGNVLTELESCGDVVLPEMRGN